MDNFTESFNPYHKYEKLALSYKNVLRAGRKDLEAKVEKELEEVNQHVGLLDDYI